MNPRLYLSPPLSKGAERTLDSEDSHYLARVLRLKPGAQLRCFDGEGSEWLAELTTSNARAIVVTLAKLVRFEHRPNFELHLAQGWLKGQSMDQVVQKATELGITDFWPISAARSKVRIDESRTYNRMHHWQRIARSATEQSERLYLPRLHQPRNLDDFLKRPPCKTLLFLEPGCAALPTDLARQSLVLMVGPEGGWTTEERNMAERTNAHLHSLGDLILRAETAPLAALAALRHGWEWR
ncbi:MAG: 16S rRNA (uracil(1498)-N(3))-methyltransferase [Gammaproteobacteria bacterium]|nr:16S rRNA (uracil(1498)-N(3))-methyltransferase [Gammaproteobacteria bacterium]